jgi:hypothetical protein
VVNVSSQDGGNNSCADSDLGMGAQHFKHRRHLQRERVRTKIVATAISTELCTTGTVVWLAADQPDDAERHANEAIEAWSHKGFHRQHYSHVMARIETELYRGDAEAAWDIVTRNWKAFERTRLLECSSYALRRRMCGGAPRYSTQPADETSGASSRSLAPTPGGLSALGCVCRSPLTCRTRYPMFFDRSTDFRRKH